MRIYTNVAGINAQRNLGISGNDLAKTFERLSSGRRINRAGDDAAGLAVSERLRSQIRGLGQAVRNAQDGISMVQTAEGALDESTSILQRMRELSVQSSSDQLTDTDRTLVQNEVSAMQTELTRIASATKYGTKSLVDGSLSASITVGTDASATNTVTITIASMDATSLGVGSISVSTVASASAAITSIDAALNTLNSTRSQIGAVQNRLEHVVANLNVAVENLSASESRIRDADFAEEVSKMTRGQILQQAGTSVAGQANQLPQGVLSLLRG